MFSETFRDKTVLVTGHTGFKGAWLSTWLSKMGAKVFGYSDKIPTVPAMFEINGLENVINHRLGDVCDYGDLSRAIQEISPDYIFYLAAQPLVSESYRDPLHTVKVNSLGVATFLEVLRNSTFRTNVVIITSDKAYENVEWVWGYRENDRLGGRDIYSGSKAAAEILINSYHNSFFADPKQNVSVAVARAGNVIGGGDWAKDRIVVDSVKAWISGKKVSIRSPHSTRPWQHVMEPLSGYLLLARELDRNSELRGQAFNFGPDASQDRSVLDLTTQIAREWGFKSANDAIFVETSETFHEATLLKLNCDKAQSLLGWTPTLNFDELVGFVVDWYKSFKEQNQDMLELTNRQIDQFESLASKSSELRSTN